MGYADGGYDASVQGAAAYTVVLLVDHVHGVVGGVGDAVGGGEDALTPRPDKSPVGLENDDGMLPAVEDVDAVVGVYGDVGALLERPAVGKLRPALLGRIRELSAA